MVALADGGRIAVRALHTRPDTDVLGLNKETWRLERRPAALTDDGRRAPVNRLTTRLGRAITAPPGQRFLTLGGWCALDALRPGDHIAVPRELPAARSRSMLDDEVALLGHLIAGGQVGDDAPLRFTTTRRAHADHVRDLVGRLFGGAVTTAVSWRGDGYDVDFASATGAPLRGWLRSLDAFGWQPDEQRVPETVFAQPALGIAHFLRHLPAHVDHAARAIVICITPSRRLAADVQSLLLRLGIAGLTERYERSGLFGVRMTAAEDILRFAQLVGGKQAEAASHLATEIGLSAEPDLPTAPLRAGDALRLVHADVYWDGVAQIEPAGVDDVFDVAVADLPGIVAGDLVLAATAA